MIDTDYYSIQHNNDIIQTNLLLYFHKFAMFAIFICIMIIHSFVFTDYYYY